MLRAKNRNSDWGPCRRVSGTSYRSSRPRGPQPHPTWTLSRRARHMGYRLECAQNLGIRHHQWAEMRPWSLNTARCRTPGVRAPRIMETVWKRIWDPRATRCRTSGVRAQGIRMIFEKRATRCRTPVVRTGEHIIFRDMRTRDQDDAFGDTRTRDQDDVRDTLVAHI